jgi:hypothetical protein
MTRVIAAQQRQTYAGLAQISKPRLLRDKPISFDPFRTSHFTVSPMLVEERAVRVFAAHLSHTITITLRDKVYLGRSIKQQQISEVVVLRQVALRDGQNQVEAFHPSCKRPSNGWERTKESVLQAIDRYPGVNAIVLTVEVHDEEGWRGDVFIDFVTEDGYKVCTRIMQTCGGRGVIELHFDVPGDDPMLTPRDLCNAINKHDLAEVKRVVSSGVNVNSAVGSISMLAVAINAAAERAEVAMAVLGWIISQPDIDWERRSYMDAPLLHQLHGNVLYTLQDVLLWDQIDIHACDDQGDNIIHCCAKTMRHDFGSLSALIAMLLHRGSGTLVLSVNDAGDRPSNFAGAITWQQLRQAEKETMTAVIAYLSEVVAVADVIGLMLQYYTSSVPIK